MAVPELCYAMNDEQKLRNKKVKYMLRKFGSKEGWKNVLKLDSKKRKRRTRN